MAEFRKWTEAEESRLVRQVRAFPQNLRKCFLIVGEEIGRSPKAVEAHWYQVASKKPQNAAFFTVSPKHKIFNRKNGKGERSSWTMFRRMLRMLGFC